MHDKLLEINPKALEAAKRGNLESLKSLLDSEPYVDDTTILDIVDAHGATLAHIASRSGHLNVLEYLVGRSEKAVHTRSRVGAEPIHDAAATGRLECVQWLIRNAGCSAGDTDDMDNNPLHLAARYGHLRLLKWLVTECDSSIRSKTQSGAIPLHFAAVRGDLDSVKFLVEQRPGSVNAQMNSGATAAYLATQEGHLETLRYLVEEGGSSVRIMAYDGMSCLHAAAQMGHLECVQWLVLNHRMRVNDRDFDGATPLHLAASQGDVGVMTWLLDNGAKMLVDALGGTPLHDAAEQGQLQSVRILIQRGCDVTKMDQDGLTAAQLAELCWQAECSALLKSRSDDTVSTYQTATYTSSLGRDPGFNDDDQIEMTSSSSSSTQSLAAVRQRDGIRRRTVPRSRQSSFSSKSSQTDQSIPPDTSDDRTSVTSSDKTTVSGTRDNLCTGDPKYFTLPMTTVTVPPPPPPPPLPPAGWRPNNYNASSGVMTKSFSTNTISTSTPSKDKKMMSSISQSQGVDLLAELKAANGMASLKRGKKRDAGSSQYYGASAPPTSQPEESPAGGNAINAFKAVTNLKLVANGLQRKSVEKTPVRTKVTLTEDYDPKKFLDKVPELDTMERHMPQWKRQLIARQLAEKAQLEATENKKTEEENTRYQDMPLWKRVLLQKRELDNRN